MRITVVILLMLATLIQGGHKFGMWICYELNKEKPELQCNGHCYLEQKMKQEEKNASFPDALRQVNEVLLYLSVYDACPQMIPAVKEIIPVPYMAMIASPKESAIFHPPRIA
jgi:hypothetical protein